MHLLPVQAPATRQEIGLEILLPPLMISIGTAMMEQLTIHCMVRFQGKEWGLKIPIGDILHYGCDKQKSQSKLDYFLLLLPPDILILIVNEINIQLHKHNKRETMAGEILKFFWGFNTQNLLSIL